MDKEKRNRQIEFLDKMSEKESAYINDSPGYCIIFEGKKEYCQSADTALMLLSTIYKSKDVWIKRAYTINQLKGK